MQTHWMMGADADQYDRSTTIISRNCPFSPKILTEETAPNMGIHYNISSGIIPFFFFSSSITPHVLHIQLYEPSNNNYIYQILYRFYNIIQTYHKKRERNSYHQHLIICYTAKKLLRSTLCVLTGVSTSHVFAASLQIVYR